MKNSSFLISISKGEKKEKKREQDITGVIFEAKRLGLCNIYLYAQRNQS